MISMRTLAEGQVYDRSGAAIGRLADLAIHRFSGQILYAQVETDAGGTASELQACLVRWNKLRPRPDGGFDLMIDLDGELSEGETRSALRNPVRTPARPAMRRPTRFGTGLSAGFGRV